MIARFWRWISHASRTERTDDVIRQMNEQAQIAEIERHRIKRARERGEPHWLEAALMPRESETYQADGEAGGETP
jgi:hypothetical protein